VHEVHGAVAAVAPASHHRPSFSTSPTMKPAAPLMNTGSHRLSSAAPMPLPLPVPAATCQASVSTTTAAAGMIGSYSNPLVGSMRQTGPKTTTTKKTATLPLRLLTDAEYMHRFRFSIHTALFAKCSIA